MELLPTLYEYSQIYAFFSLVTALTVLVINAQLLWLVKPFGFAGSLSYLITTLVVTFLFAPVFMFILIFYGEVYKSSITVSLLKNIDHDE